jgi:hypothetical protein
MYEPKSSPPLSPSAFTGRMLAHVGIATALIAVSLLIGVLGYHGTEGQPWLDAFLSASMILTGMGPTGELHTTGGKLFASFYALYSGAIFLVVLGVVVAPLVHRMLHRFHIEERE